MTIVAVSGLSREAALFSNPEVTSVVSGGNFLLLRERLDSTGNDPIAGVMSIGIGGALVPSLRVGDCILASNVIADGRRLTADSAWIERLSARLSHATVVTIAGTDTILVESAMKAELHRRTGAQAADMESHVAALFAAERKVPFAALRVVSDTADMTLPPAVLRAMKPDGSIDVGAVMRSVLTNPLQLPALIRTARDSEIAFRALLRCRDLLGPRLAGPDVR